MLSYYEAIDIHPLRDFKGSEAREIVNSNENKYSSQDKTY